MQDLQARIRQLEADNASLATAADQAAALAEEYAGDAARYRAANNSSQTALVNELTDATRRKDRRIQRLTTLLDNEKKRAEGLQRRVEELEQVNEYPVHNVKEARDLSQTVDDRPTRQDKSPPVPSCTPIKVLSALESILPPDVRGIFAAFRVFFISESVRAWTTHVSLASKSETGDGDFAKLAKLIDETVRRSVAWCFASPPNLAERGIMLEKGMSSLEERVEALSREIAEGQSHRWTAEYSQMKQDLVGMPIEVLKSVVPGSWTRVQNEDEMDFHEICTEQARHMKGILTSEEREVHKKAMEELNSKLNAVRLTLEQKNRELDDLHVRTSIFKERLDASRKDKENMKALQDKLTTVDKELAVAKATAKKAEMEPFADSPSAKVEKQPRQPEVFKSGLQESPRERAKRTNETVRLRRMLVRSQMADLQSRTSLSDDADARLRETMQVRNAVSKALNDARTAASMARVVRLDPETLEPKIEGVTMSRKTILQSLGALEKQTGVARCDVEVSRYSVQYEASLDDEAGMFTNLAAIIRELS